MKLYLHYHSIVIAIFVMLIIKTSSFGTNLPDKIQSLISKRKNTYLKKPFLITENSDTKKNIRYTSAGSISGTVYDANGSPYTKRYKVAILDTFGYVHIYDYPQSNTYKLDLQSAGTYYVLVDNLNFYPNTTDPMEATKVIVSDGNVITDVDITITEEPLYNKFVITGIAYEGNGTSNPIYHDKGILNVQHPLLIPRNLNQIGLA